MRTLLPFILSILLPGLGQIILKSYWKGIIMLFLSLILGFFIDFIPFPFLYYAAMIWSLFDIYFSTEQIEGKAKAKRSLIFSLVLMIVIFPAIMYLFFISAFKGGEYLNDKYLNVKNTEKEMAEISSALDRFYSNFNYYPSDFSKFVNSKPIW